MKIKIGRKYKVRKDLDPEKRYGGKERGEGSKCGVNVEMLKFRSKIITIKNQYSINRYRAKETMNWKWAKEMLEQMSSRIKIN